MVESTQADLLTAPEVAQILRVSEDRLVMWRHRKQGPPYVKLVAGNAGSIRYSRSDLEAWVAANTRLAASPGAAAAAHEPQEVVA